jgi:hypothetical protein
MQVVSLFILPYTEKGCKFSEWKVVKRPTRSLDSPYIEHCNPHFHTKHRMNRLPCEYINT